MAPASGHDITAGRTSARLGEALVAGRRLITADGWRAANRLCRG